jgi:hypothetical protein
MSDFRDEFAPDETKMTRELRDILDSAVRDEPPLFLDPAQIVAAGEIRSWRRRLGASVVLTALAAIAVVATAIPFAARHGSRSHPAGAASEATHAPASQAPSTSTSPPMPATSPRRGTLLPADPKLAGQLTAVLIKVLPLKIGHFRPAPPGTAPLVFTITDGVYEASGDVVDQLGYGHVAVTVSAGSQAMYDCETQGLSCYRQPGPNGAELTIRTSVAKAGGHDWMVVADRMDGTEVTVQVSDHTWAAGAMGSPPSQRDLPPLTMPQMIDLATSPALHA